MHHAAIAGIAHLGIKLFHAATQHHNDISTALQLVQVGRQLYKIGSEVQQSTASTPMLVSQWRDDDGDPSRFVYYTDYGLVEFSFLSTRGNLYTWKGAGKVDGASIDMIVSGYSGGGAFHVMRGISNDGYSMDMAIWAPDHGIISYYHPRRVSEWSLERDRL